MSESPYSAPASSLGHEQDSDLIEFAIGDSKTNYYLRYLEGAGDRNWVPSWHWPAFFVTSGWLLYRKLWSAWFLYVFGLPIVAVLTGALVAVALGEGFGAVAQTIIVVGCYFVLTPIFANALYARKLRRLVATAAAHSDNREKRIQWLAKRGGTSLVWLVVLLFPFVISILAAVSLPAYQDYIEAANMTKVNSHYEEAARYIQIELRKVQADIALGGETLANFQPTYDSARWIADLNLAGGRAPSGGSPYAIEVDDELGVIGVVVTGSVMIDPITYQATITRPAYGGYQAVATKVIRWIDI